MHDRTGACLSCGTTFTYRIKNGRDRKYCSRPCSYAGATGRKVIVANPVQYAQTTCQSCGADVTYRPKQSKRDRRYCSRACYTTHWPTLKENRSGVWLVGVCQGEACGREYEYRQGKARAGKFCSIECYRAELRRASVARHAGTPAPMTKPCLVCEGPVPYWPSTSYRKFCSIECKGLAQKLGLASGPTAQCVSCDESYMRTSQRQRWCPTCVPDAKARGRMQRYGLTDLQWRAMLDRFDGKCWICHEWPATVVDHDHETGRNRGAACLSCNTGLHYVDRPGWIDAARAYIEEVSQHCG